MKRTVEVLDLTGIPCPMNSARALVKLAQMPCHSCLEIILDDGEPSVNVPVSIEDEGYRIIDKTRRGKQWMLRIQRLD
jgi:TusA-related sulfurtransferase